MGLDLTADFDAALRGNPARSQREFIAARENERIAAEDARVRAALDHEPVEAPHRGAQYQSTAEDAKEKEPEHSSKRRRGRPKGSGAVQQVRDVPSGLIVAIRQSHPVFLGQGLEEASPLNLTDTMAAFCAFNLGYDGDDLSERAREAVSVLKKSDEGLVSLNSRMRHLEQQNAHFASLLEEVSLGNAFMLFDRLGFRRNTPASPTQVDFEEPDLERMRQRIRDTAKEKVRQDRINEGRPKS